ncbi:MAG: SH3 domain-containing protein [Clostridia bacterium]|nr:SH3 domain-containing protein [Clostridia bacterium]
MTADTFIFYLRQALDEGWGYIWGTSGQVWTAASQAAADREATRKYGARWIGKRVADCSGLLAWAARAGGASLPHGSNSIWRNCLRASGEINRDTVLAPGTAVFKRSAIGGYDHIGLWDGEKVIEAKGTRYGVVASSLSGFTHWGALKIIDGTEKEPLNGPCRVTGGALNLRAAPAASADRLALLADGTEVTVTEDLGTWCRVEVRLTGCLSKRFLQACE